MPPSTHEYSTARKLRQLNGKLKVMTEAKRNVNEVINNH